MRNFKILVFWILIPFCTSYFHSLLRLMTSLASWYRDLMWFLSNLILCVLVVWLVFCVSQWTHPMMDPYLGLVVKTLILLAIVLSLVLSLLQIPPLCLCLQAHKFYLFTWVNFHYQFNLWDYVNLPVPGCIQNGAFNKWFWCLETSVSILG